MNKRGFTLLELMVTVTIIGILAGMASFNYARAVEKSRTGEAKRILGQMREAQIAYNIENDDYGAMADLGLNVTEVCAGQNTFYFRYGTDGPLSTGTCWAVRCDSGGKSPSGPSAYQVNMTIDGLITSTSSYI